MRNLSILACLMVVTALLLPAASPQAKRSAQDPYNQWVLKCLKDFEAIKPGITRGDVLKRLVPEPHFPGESQPEVFFHTECPYFKMDIEFVTGADFSPNDKVVKVSKPYLERVHF